MPQFSSLQTDILSELGISQLPEEKQEEVLTAMTEVILKRIALVVLGELGEENRKEFDAISAEGDADKMNDFLSQKISNYDQKVQDEIGKFKQEMKETVDALLV